MNQYIAIGHFKNLNENVTHVTLSKSSKDDFKIDLRGNAFAAYAILTPQRMDKLLSLDSTERWEEIKKICGKSRVRQWNITLDYIEQCQDYIRENLIKSAE